MSRIDRRFQLANDGGVTGLRCTAEGLSLGVVPLLRKTGDGFTARSTDEIEDLMKAAYGDDFDAGGLPPGLDVVAQALTRGDLGRAMIAALHLRLPKLSPDEANRIAEVDAVLAKYDPSEPRDARGRWTAGGEDAPAEVATGGDAAAARMRLGGDQADPALLIPVSNTVYPWVTTFRNQHLADAIKLAAVIGHGATADEVLATSGNESKYGNDYKAQLHGNFFGIHSNGTDPSRFLPGQIGAFPTKTDGPMAAFDLKNAYFRSGLIFANKMASAAGEADLSDPATFFSLAHAHGWGTTTANYVSTLVNIHGLFRNSARHSERSS